LFGDMQDLDFIGSSVSDNSYYETQEDVTSLVNCLYFGVKPEYILKNSNFGISTGIRYSRMHSSIEGASQYFYMLYRENGTNTEYLRARKIDQTSQYIGIPLEVRYFVASVPDFRIYIKLGVDFNIRLQTKTKVDFYDPSMSIYETDIINKLITPKTFYSSFYTSVGYRIGNDLKPSLTIELLIPFISNKANSSSLVKANSGVGLQVIFQVPLKSKEK
jgi:hypothetical protein